MSVEKTMYEQMMEDCEKAKREKEEQENKKVTQSIGTSLKGLKGAFKETEAKPKLEKCGNPNCNKVESTPGEYNRCKRCKSIKYCSRDCQAAHWSIHKKECKIHKDELPLLKATTDKMANLQINEVQQAMNKMMDQLNYDKSWITDDLIHEIQNNPILSQNEHNTQSPEFIKEMMRVLGDHFTKIGKERGETDTPIQQQPSQQQLQPQNTMNVDPEVEKVLSNPEVKSLLMQPEVMNMLRDCTQPGRLNYYMSNPKSSEIIKKLAQYGLVQIHP